MKGLEQWFWIIFGVIAGVVLLTGFVKMYAGIIEEHELKSQIMEFDRIASSFAVLCGSPPESADNLSIFISDRVFSIYVSSDESKPPVDARRRTKRLEKKAGNYLCIQLKPVNRRKPVCRKMCEMNMTYITVPSEETILSKALKLLGRKSRFEWRIYAERTPRLINVTACLRGSEEGYGC